MGQAGIDTLYAQLDKTAGSRALGQRAGTCGPWSGTRAVPRAARARRDPVGQPVKDEGWSSEELKVRNESRKILGLPDLRVSATCVRVPVVTTHSVAVHASFGREVTRSGAQRVLSDVPGWC